MKQGCYSSRIEVKEDKMCEHDIMVSFTPNNYIFTIGGIKITSIQVFYLGINEEMAERMKKIALKGADYDQQEFENWFNEVLKAYSFIIRWENGLLTHNESGLRVRLWNEKETSYSHPEAKKVYEIITKGRC